MKYFSQNVKAYFQRNFKNKKNIITLFFVEFFQRLEKVKTGEKIQICTQICVL